MVDGSTMAMNSSTSEKAASELHREVTELSGERKLDVLLAVAAFVFGYIWAANARMDMVWAQGYEVGLRSLAEACGEEPGSGVPPAQAMATGDER